VSQRALEETREDPAVQVLEGRLAGRIVPARQPPQLEGRLLVAELVDEAL
jgi:hypothetical protein